MAGQGFACALEHAYYLLTCADHLAVDLGKGLALNQVKLCRIQAGACTL